MWHSFLAKGENGRQQLIWLPPVRPDPSSLRLQEHTLGAAFLSALPCNRPCNRAPFPAARQTAPLTSSEPHEGQAKPAAHASLAHHLPDDPHPELHRQHASKQQWRQEPNALPGQAQPKPIPVAAQPFAGAWPASRHSRKGVSCWVGLALCIRGGPRAHARVESSGIAPMQDEIGVRAAVPRAVRSCQHASAPTTSGQAGH